MSSSGSQPLERGFRAVALRNLCFRALEGVDELLHSRGFTWVRLCRLVGRLEPGYYERTTNWANPLYVNPEREPELYAKHAASLCVHGYSEGCPDGCAALSLSPAPEQEKQNG